MIRILKKILKVFIKTLYIVTFLLILFAGIALYLLETQPGLNNLIQLTRLYLPGTLKIEQIEGSFLDHFTLKGIEYNNESLKLKVAQLNVQWQPRSLWDNQFITAQWKNLRGYLKTEEYIHSEKGNITATGVLHNMQFNLSSQITTAPEERWLLQGKIKGSPPWNWTFDTQLNPTQNGGPSQQTRFYTKLSAKGEIISKNQGNLLLKVSPGFYHDPASKLPPLQFKGGSIQVLLTPEKLKGSGNLILDESKNVKVELLLPHFALDKGLQDDQPINSELLLELNSLDFLQKISPEITKLKGQLMASLNIHGTLKNRKMDSRFMLKKASLSLPKIGLDFNTIEVNVYGKESSWVALGLAESAGHHLSLSGKGNFDSQFTGNFTLEGTDFPLIQTSEYKVHVTPKLKLQVTPKVQSLSGTILIPLAEIKPRTFHNSISLPEDVVYQQKVKSATPTVDATQTIDIKLEMGKEVQIDVKGLKGYLDGILHIKSQQSSMNAFGELTVRDGTYKAYGLDLKIKQGELIFKGPIDNPGINLRAAKKIAKKDTTYSSSTQLLDFNSSNVQNFNFGETITLGVEVSGRLTHPKIQLFSDPAVLSQADILSMLVIGRPANQANKAGGQLLLAAISSMNLGSNTNSLQLLQQLKQTAGIDFNVQTNTNYNQSTNTSTETTSVVVGKSISKRLYLSYNIGVSQTDTNMLTLRYLLNRFFSIQISNSNNSSAIDFMYTSNKKPKKKKTSRKTASQ
ncbi:periplasmic protein [Legionella wadsworthii]|uniref:Periplasmic protein n=1 Tax=Legionella wadsworthii TaxID=28088 RepID=A0A378LT19_9GAMM|nr:translocation/assembly module TamB domain-containing protein [Legionella wadsworthii]STY28979.1 periplasmic protein [Legionella wadsworthii]